MRSIERRIFIFALLGLLTLLGVTLLVRTSGTPALRIQVSTQTLPTLLPHAHGAGNKISDVLHGIPIRSEPFENPQAIWITKVTVNTTNAPSGIIHHLNVYRLNEDGTHHMNSQPLLTTGQDTPDHITFPAPAGIFVAAGEKIGIEAVLHNPIPPYGEGEVYKDVVVTLTFEGEPEGANRNVPIQFLLPRVTDSVVGSDEDSTFAVPTGATQFTRTSTDNPAHSAPQQHVFNADGWILYAAGHLHPWEGGEHVDLLLNGHVLRSYRSRLLDADVPWSWRTESGHVMKRVKRGDVLTVSATYSNTGEEPIVGAMGMLAVFYTQDLFSLDTPTHEVAWYAQSWFYTVLNFVGIKTS